MRKRLVVACLYLFSILGVAGAAERPTIFLIGDSTVRNGRGDGAGALWGWGDIVAGRFDTNKVRIVNRALGGRSSRTFFTEGLWDKVKTELHPGDFVLMQFGHNDGGEISRGDRPRASLKGNGDESKEVTLEKTGASETVHSYGWYLRRYIADTKAAGATPVVLSPIPRNIWKDGKVARASDDYSKWAAEAARGSGALFLDLNELVARRYEEIGEPRVASEFFTAKDHTHTTRSGAELNADCVALGLRDLNDSPFKSLFRSN
jgi:rhamnogalacturonan acetylesterase